MDPQMVWDMIDELETQDNGLNLHTQSPKEHSEPEEKTTTHRASSPFPFMTFSSFFR